MIRNCGTALACGLLCLSMLAGCASPETAVVNFSYVVEATRGLPAGMKTITIMPAKLGPTTDEKWSEMCVTIMNSLVNESRNSFGTALEVSDRRDTQVTFDEADLAAAGMSTGTPGAGGRLEAAQGAILSKIDVKIERHMGKQRTLSGLSFLGGGGRHWGHGGGDIRTQEVQTVTRNITVIAAFKLLDTATNKVWEYYAPKTFQATDRTKASPIFGSSRTEAELTPTDRIIATLVERAAREFISRLMPCRIDIATNITSSRNESCIRGVRLLRAEDFEGAYSNFVDALVQNPDDHRAAYGAGLACEASGRPDEALKYYKRACAGQENATYRDARDRMKVYADRARG